MTYAAGFVAGTAARRSQSLLLCNFVLDLSATQRRSLYAAVRKAVSAANAKASLPAKEFAGVGTVGDIVDVVTRALRDARTGAEGRVDNRGEVSRRRTWATTKKPAWKAAAKKSVAKKATVKKGAVKKTARKTMLKKRPMKKAAAKKVVRKPAARKPPPPPGAPEPKRPVQGFDWGVLRGWAAREADRLEVDRLEVERLEARRLNARRMEADRLEAQRLEAVQETERHMSIWIGDGETPFKRVLTVGRAYVLNFKVGEPVAGSLTTGPEATVPVRDIPIGGLVTEWMVLGHGAELAAGTPDTTATAETIGGVLTWTGRFSLLIPQAGDSAVPRLTIKPLKPNPHVDVVVIARGELYRQFKILLTAAADPGKKRTEPSRIGDELMPTPTGHIGTSTRHEWTTPESVLTVTVVGSQAVVHGDVSGTEVRSFEPWVGVQAQVNGPIKNVRDAAEELRAAWEIHLDNINPADLADRLQRWRKKGWGGPEYSWRAFGDYANSAHRQQWEYMAVSVELRKLAQLGWRLFRAFFPAGSNLHDWISRTQCRKRHAPSAGPTRRTAPISCIGATRPTTSSDRRRDGSAASGVAGRTRSSFRRRRRTPRRSSCGC